MSEDPLAVDVIDPHGLAHSPEGAGTKAGKAAVRSDEHRRFIDGVRDALPVVMGYLAIGLAFGVVARTTGLTVAEVALMSLILYAGSSQFVLAGLVAASPSG